MATAMDQKPATQTVPLQSNYWELYPRREEIALASVQQVSEGLGVRLSLRTSVKDFAHYLCSQSGEAPQESRDGEMTVRFRRLGDARPQHITTEIQAVSRSGQKTKPHRITIGYYPKELYAASGQTAPNWVIVQNTDLALSRTAVVLPRSSAGLKTQIMKDIPFPCFAVSPLPSNDGLKSLLSL